MSMPLLSVDLNKSITTKSYAKTNLYIDIVLASALIALLVFLPLINVQQFANGTQSGKFLFFLYSVLLIVSVYTARQLLVSPYLKIKINILDLCFTTLMSYIAVNRYFLQQDYSFSFAYYELVGLFVLYIVIRSCQERLYIALLCAIIFSGIVQAIYGNLQLYHLAASNNENFNLTGSFFNPGPFACFLAAVFTIALGLYLFGDGITKTFNNSILQVIIKYLPPIGIIAILLILPATQSRAAWLGCVASTSFLLLTKYKIANVIIKQFKGQSVRELSIIAALVALLVVTTIWLYQFKKESVDGRMVIWRVAAQMVEDKPFLGFGFDNFKTHYMNYQANYFQDNVEATTAIITDDITYAFNDPLQFVAENGMVGFTLGVLTLGLLFLTKDARNSITITAKAVLISLIVFSLFSYPSQILPIKLILVVSVAIIASQRSNIAVLNFRYPNIFIERITKSLLFAVVLTVILFTATFLQHVQVGLVSWQQALSMNYERKYDESLKPYIKAFSVFKEEGMFLANFGKALYIADEPAMAIEILQLAQKSLSSSVIETTLGDSYKALYNYNEAEATYIRASHMTPGRFYPKYLLAKLYDESAQSEKAMKLAQEILKKEAKIKSQAVEEIKFEMQKILNKNAF